MRPLFQNKYRYFVRKKKYLKKSMSIGVSRSVRVIHNRYESKLNSTQDFNLTFPWTPLTSSWGEHEGERPCTTVLYIPCIWCSSNNQENPPKSVCVRLWVGRDTSHLVWSPRPSNRHVNITATETTCQLRTPPNTTGWQTRAWRGGDTSLTLSMNLSVCAGVSENHLLFRLNPINPLTLEVDI